MSQSSRTSLGRDRDLARSDAPPRARRHWLLRLPFPWPLWPATIFFLLYLVAPLAVVFYYSLQPNPLTGSPDAGLSLGNYRYFLGQPHYVNVVARTLRFAALTTVASVAIGYGAALVLRRVSERVGSLAALVLTFPILSGPIVTVMGWMITFTSGGVVGQSLALFRSLLGLPEASTRLLGTDLAVMVGMVHFNLAFVILNLLSVILQIPPSLEEAAMNLGASPWRTFWHVIWPMSLPGLFSAALISFALSMNAFVTPMYLGNPSRPVMTTLISQFMLTSYNWQMASATSVILLWLSLVVIFVSNWLYGRSLKF